jgi:hypothetical protein
MVGAPGAESADPFSAQARESFLGALMERLPPDSPIPGYLRRILLDGGDAGQVLFGRGSCLPSDAGTPLTSGQSSSCPLRWVRGSRQSPPPPPQGSGRRPRSGGRTGATDAGSRSSVSRSQLAPVPCWRRPPPWGPCCGWRLRVTSSKTSSSPRARNDLHRGPRRATAPARVARLSLGLVGVVALIAVSYPAVRGNAELDQTFAQPSPAVRSLLGLTGGTGLTSPAGYLDSQFFANLLPVLLLVFGPRCSAGGGWHGHLRPPRPAIDAHGGEWSRRG